MAGLNLLVDPILVGNLDFGFPWLYDAAKKFVKNFKVSDVCVLEMNTGFVDYWTDLVFLICSWMISLNWIAC